MLTNNRTAITVMSLMVLCVMLFTDPPMIHATNIKFATLMPDGVQGFPEIKKAFQQIRKETNEEVQITIYAGGVCGDEADVIRKMKTGRIHMAQFSGYGVGKILPALRVIENAGVFENYAEADYAKAKLLPEFEAGFEKQGFVLLGLAEVGVVYVFSQQDISKLEHFKKVKMWTWMDDPLTSVFFEELGMPTVPLHLSDVNVGLQTGMIDTFFAPPMIATSFQWYTRCKNVLDYPITQAMGVYLMTKKALDQMSPENREIFRKIMREVSNEVVQITRKVNAESFELIRGAGVKIVTPSPEQVAEIRKVAIKSAEQHMAKGIFSKELYDRMNSLVQENRKKK